MWIGAPAEGDLQLLKAAVDVSYVTQLGWIPTATPSKPQKE